MPGDQVLTYFLIFAILLGAYYIRGIAGYGSGLIAIPTLALFMPLEFVVPYVGALDYLAALGHGLHHRRSVQWKEIALIIPLSALGMLFAMFLFIQADREALKIWLGGFVILYALYSLLPLPQFKGSRIWALPFTTTGGVVDTLFGTGGPFYVIYLRLRQLDPTSFVATIAMAFMIATGIRLGGYAVAGFYELKTVLLVIASLPLVMLGMHLGMRTHSRLSARQFSAIIAVLLLTAGASLIAQY
ncbi:MAG: sulfite exporter TauE/SafE family protein [Gammaproteobacteria bacterium]|nr:sulfite exporter TauE/SafE family protein [Gammaproteobacteria bacterium]